MEPLTSIPDVERAKAVKLIEIAFYLYETFFLDGAPISRARRIVLGLVARARYDHGEGLGGFRSGMA